MQSHAKVPAVVVVGHVTSYPGEAIPGSMQHLPLIRVARSRLRMK